jgi:hypothetical protein
VDSSTCGGAFKNQKAYVKSWLLTEPPELVGHEVTDKRYQELLDQIGNSLYLYFASSNQKRGVKPSLGSSAENHLSGRTRPERKVS